MKVRNEGSDMKRYVLCALIVLILVTPALVGQTNVPGSGDQLQQLTARLQQSPGDQALREKIIALALTINPKPATPDAATMAEGAAEYAFKNAKANSDFSDAAKQYEKALVLAPWLAADYFNCGVAHEKAGENKEAIRSFNLYLLAAPNADDALAVKKRIGGLQYVAEKAEEQSKAAANEARAQADEAARREAEISIGAHHGGGIIFYIDGTGQHGLIAATADQGTGNWDHAVQLCRDYRGGGYADWYMPSKDQLNTLYSQKELVGGFEDNLYSSSTEFRMSKEEVLLIHNVWIQDFTNGTQWGPKGKSYLYYRVRAIRNF
jgi:tetratricopeptide (TPR) repeat protein